MNRERVDISSGIQAPIVPGECLRPDPAGFVSSGGWLGFKPLVSSVGNKKESETVEIDRETERDRKINR